MVQTGICFKRIAIGMPIYPTTKQKIHCTRERGVVFAKVPKYSTIMIWKTTVAVMTATNT